MGITDESDDAESPPTHVHGKLALHQLITEYRFATLPAARMPASTIHYVRPKDSFILSRLSTVLEMNVHSIADKSTRED